MVRETRHLWVGNLPENVREEKIVEHFSRYGRVESVKILPKRSAEGGRAAFVDFVDIRSATKAHESVNRIGDRELRTDYNEPSAPSSIARLHHEPTNRSAPSSPTRSSRRYERRGEGISEGRPYYSEGYSDEEGSVSRSSGPSIGRGRYGNTRRPAYKPEPYRQSPAHSSVSGSGSGSGRSRSQSPSSSSSSSGESEEESRSLSPSSNMPRANRSSVLCVKNLSSRSSDASVKEGMYHEFKKYGEVPRIHIHGQGSSRYATVHFRRHDDAERAFDVCQGKMFLGSDMEIQRWSGEERFHNNDAPSRPRTSGFGLAPDEDFDPACTRTLFVGNIEKTMTCSDLRAAFGHFGEILDVDIKKSGGNNPYAFLQFEDLGCAIQARRRMDREFVGRNRVKVGFGKVAAINTIWVGGVTASLSEQQVDRHFSRYGRVTRVVVDRARGQALVSFDGVESASFAQAEMKGRTMFGRRVQVELVSRDSRQLFCDTLQRGGAADGHSSSRRYDHPSPPPLRSRGRGGPGHYDNRRGRGGSHGGMRRDSRNSGYRSSWHGGQYDYPDGGRTGGGFHRQSGSRNRFEGNFDNDDYDQELREYDYSRQRERERERERAQQRRDRHPRDRDDGNYGNSGDRFYPEHRNDRDRWPDDDSSSGSYEESRDRKEARPPRDYHAERGPDYALEVEGRGSAKGEYRDERKDRQQTRKKERTRSKPAESATSTDGGTKEPDSENSSSEDGRVEPKKHKVTKGQSLESKVPLPAVDTRYVDSPERGEVDGVANRKRRDGGDLVSSSLRADKEPKKKRKHRPRTPVRTPERENAPEGDEDGEIARNATPTGEDTGGKEDEERGDHVELQKANHERPAPITETRLSKSPMEGHDDWEQVSRTSQKSYRDDRRRDWTEGAEKPKRRRASRDGSPQSPAPDPGPRSPRKPHREERRRDWDQNDVRRPAHWRSPHEESPPPPPPPPPPPERVAPPLDGRADDRGTPAPPSRAAYDVPQMPLLLEGASYEGNGPTRPSPHGLSPGLHSPVVPSVVPPSPAMPLPPTLQLEAPPVASLSPSCVPMVSGGSVPPAPPPPAPAAPSNPDTLLELLRRYPVVWQGLLALKNDTAAVQMHYLAGNARLAELSLPQLPQPPGIGSVPPPIRIAQRMRLEPSQLDGVIRRMQSESEHCLLLALPCGRDPLDVHKQTRGLKSGFISYLQHKQAAGIINVPRPGSTQPSYVLHIFPPCDFAQGHLARVAPDLLDSAADSGHLMVVVASV